MKNFFKIHPRRDARGLIIGLVLILAIAFIVNLFGCGNDTVTNNTGNPPVTNNDSLIWSIDSFTVYSDQLNNTSMSFSYTDTTNSIRKYKIVAEGISNVPVSTDTAFIDYASIGYPNGPLQQLWKRNAETNNYHIDYTYNITDTSLQYTQIRHYFSAGFSVTYPTIHQHYISIKKFHLYIVH